MPDLYTQILGVLYLDLSKEEQATMIRKIVDEQIIQKFQELLMDYERECGR